jgi:magnesium and cobalt transporter
MLEGVLRMADMTAGDVMVAAPRMDLLAIDAPYDELLAAVIGTGHSRFPVFEGQRENIIGTMMAKDLLKVQRSPELNLRTLLRPAVFVPESKNLNELLREFRSNRNHLAIVIDEFGNTAGLITIEDVLEEIVGEIEDEFDEDNADESGIVSLADGSQRVAGNATIAAVNHAFGIALPQDAFDTIGGIVAHELGHVPRRGEATRLGGLLFTVMLTRGGAVRWFKVTRPAADAGAPHPDELGG